MKPIRTFVTPVIIAALAVTGLSAVPARADSSDIAKLLVGIAAVAVVARAIDNNRKPKATTSRHTISRDPVIIRPPQRNGNRHRRVSFALPERCLTTYRGRNRDRQLFSGRCLSRVDYRLAELPKRCEYIVSTRQGRGKAYGPRCLARAGFYMVDGDRNRRNDRPRHITYDF